jgi:lipoprotein NlpI
MAPARDAEAYLAETEWSEGSAPYAAFVASLARLRLKQVDESQALLARASSVVGAKAWTAQITQFLQGALSSATLLDRAKGRGEETEAHTYISIRAAIENKRDEAQLHLKWVQEKGARTFIEYQLALAELRRLR